MLNFIEKTVFLRTLNYIRIEHGYRKQFHFVIPSVLSALILLPIFIFASDPNIFGQGGLLAGFSQLLAILAPFFIASLAAVATFAANETFDKKFKMAEPVQLNVLEKGKFKTRDISLRQFLSLLFGYCGVISLTLFLITLVGPIISSGLADFFGWWASCLGKIFFILFVFIFCHMITATLLGLYYLSDKMHRNDSH